MKKNNFKWLLCFSTLFILSTFSTVKAQSFEPVVGTNYYYLTRGVWQMTAIDLDTNSVLTPEDQTIKFVFSVGLPLGTSNWVRTIQNDTLSNPMEYTFSSSTQEQIIINPNTSSPQTFTIDYIDDNMFIYRSNYDVGGTTYNYTFKLMKVN
ncbi:MAG: hypothetical protein ACTHJT_09520 [Cytophaga sp.]|uniref:hypothetical protein n=1 Tax=Cytophaga sp. TaxID=29535 RepID=UPI003F7E67CD